jgi:hypothetical protein
MSAEDYMSWDEMVQLEMNLEQVKNYTVLEKCEIVHQTDEALLVRHKITRGVSVIAWFGKAVIRWNPKRKALAYQSWINPSWQLESSKASEVVIKN